MSFGKIFISFIIFLIYAHFAPAQTKSGSKGIVIEPYMGYITGDLEDRFFDDSKASHLGAPLSYGHRIEFKMNRVFSFGFDVNYANVKLGWTKTFYPVTSTAYNAEYFKETVWQERSVEKFRFLVNFKTYFMQSATFETYAVFGFGAKWVRQTDLLTQLPVSESRLPFTQRVGLGWKYYVIPNMGLTTEIGLGGGSPIQVGLSLKL